MICKAIIAAALLVFGLAGTAHALDTTINLDNFKAQVLPEEHSYEEAQLCASIVYMNKMINDGRSPDSRNYENLVQQTKVGWAIWMPRALDRYNQATGESLTQDDYIEKVVKPNGTTLYNQWDDGTIPGATLYFFDKYCLDHMADVTVMTAPN